MDWGSIGKTVGSFAPVLGGLLLGPAGGKAGALISKVLGCANTPEAVSQAVQQDPEAFVKIKKIESDERVSMADIALEEKTMLVKSGSQDLENVNITMREESKAEDSWTRRWRPYWGFISGTAFAIVCVGLIIIIAKAVWKGDYEVMAHIPSLISAIAMLFSVPAAILGVASWHRGMKQRIDAGEVGQPGIMGAIANRIKR